MNKAEAIASRLHVIQGALREKKNDPLLAQAPAHIIRTLNGMHILIRELLKEAEHEKGGDACNWRSNVSGHFGSRHSYQRVLRHLTQARTQLFAVAVLVRRDSHEN